MGICPEEEFEAMMEAFRNPLPQAVRVNSLSPARHAVIDQCKILAGCELGPRELTWMPGQRAWQWDDLDRREIKKTKSKGVKRLKDFLVSNETAGNLSRQETVSMIPVEFLGVKGTASAWTCALPRGLRRGRWRRQSASCPTDA